jgi:hypothetical protein
MPAAARPAKTRAMLAGSGTAVDVPVFRPGTSTAVK